MALAYDITKLVGKRYNHLLILGLAENRGKQRAVYCECECGNIKVIKLSRVMNGFTKSCGCLHKRVLETTHKNNIKDWVKYEGKKIGMMTLLEYIGVKGGKVMFNCKCDCGEFKLQDIQKLLCGDTVSCGCFRKSMKGDKNPNRNPNISDEDRKPHRDNKAIIRRRNSVFARDNYTCQSCGDRNGNGKNIVMNSHHLNSYNDHEELRYEITNGITLCTACHKNFHKIYGKGWNTHEQFLSFKLEF